MGYRVLQNSFLGGVISPSLLGRVDLSDYQQGAYELKNFLINPQGSITSRGGFRYVAPLKEHDKPARLISFRFSSEQTLVLVFGHKWMRIMTEGKQLLNKDGTPYEIQTPYTSEDVFNLDYTQNADIITLTNPNHPPRELRRYGATDWRLVDCSFSPAIKPPSSVSGAAFYPPETQGRDKGTVTATYVVTAVDKDNRESTASQECTIKCNYYLTGGYSEISWSKVGEAKYYRVYREVAGIFGFLGETEKTSILDYGDNPDTTYTPPRYEVVFENKSGIKAVEVIDGGSGYRGNSDDVVVDSSTSIAYPFSIVSAIWCPAFYQYGARSSIRNAITGQYASGMYCLPEIWLKFGLKKNPNDTDYAGLSDPLKLTLVDAQRFMSTAKVPIQHGGSVTLTRYYGVYVPDVPAGQLKITFKNLKGEINAPYICLAECGSDWEYKITANGWHPITHKTSLDWSHYQFIEVDEGEHGGGMTDQSGTIASTPYKFVPKFWLDVLRDKKYEHIQRDHKPLFENHAPDCVRKLMMPSGCPIEEWVHETNSFLDKKPKSDIELIVHDATGSGAELQANVQDGKIVSVTVVKSGSNYTNPTIEVKSKYGSGAKLKAILFEKSDYDYPSANTQYDQRRIFAGTYVNPVKVWMTNAGQQDLMMYHLPTMADDRISLEAVTSDADRIIHAVALDSLILFSRSAELRVFTQNSDSLSPDSVAVRAQSYVGSNNVQPIICNANVLYGAARGGHLRVLNYAYSAQGYQSADLSLVCPHLFDNYEIKDIALSKAPVQVVWVITSNGKLNALTYYPEQEIKAWSVFETQGEFESCCVVSEGKEDHLYCVIKRTINGETRRYVERLEYINIPDDAASYRQLDSFIDNTGVTMADTDDGVMLTGLEHLNGCYVLPFIDGMAHKPVQVVDGSIRIAQNGANIAVGLPYVSRLTTVPITSSEAQAGMQSFSKNPSEIYLRCRFDGDIWAEATGSNEMWQVQRDDLAFSGQLKDSQTLNVNLTSAWQKNGQITIEHRDQLPLEINSIIGNYSYEGYKQ